MKLLKSNLHRLILFAALGWLIPAVVLGAGVNTDIKGSSSISTPGYTGSGLDDITVGGIYTGDGDKCYEVEIDGTGSPDTFKWRPSCGSGAYSAATVNVSTSATTLGNGVTVLWAASTGHTSGGVWRFKTTSVQPLRVKDAAGNNIGYWQNDGSYHFLAGGQVLSTGILSKQVVIDSQGIERHYALTSSIVEVKHASFTITDSDSGKHYTNAGAGGNIAGTLPPARAGLRYKFTVGESGKQITIQTVGDDVIRCNASSSSAPGSAASSTRDDSITIEAIDATNWQCMQVAPAVTDWPLS